MPRPQSFLRGRLDHVAYKRKIEVGDRHGDDHRIEAIQQPSMTRKNVARVLYPGDALQSAFRQVAELPDRPTHETKHDEVKPPQCHEIEAPEDQRYGD